MGDRPSSFAWREEVWMAGLALAAFLALVWLLRGAPPGQKAPEDRDADGSPSPFPPARRDLAVAGAVAGLVLVPIAGYAAARYGVPWSLPVFAAAFGLLMSVGRATRPYRHAGPTMRRLASFADAALNAALLGGVLIVGNVLAFKYGERPIDMTRERAFSLESLTINQLRSLKKPVTFTAFFGRGGQSAAQLERVRQLLELYRAENPRMVKVVELNPFTDIEAFERLVKDAPDVATASGGGVVVAYGEGESVARAVVRYDELFELPGGAGEDPSRFVSAFRGEDALTSALVRLREGKRYPVVFTAGHGEPSIHDSEPNRPGLGLLRARLEAVGAQPIAHSLSGEPLPADTAVLIIVDPRTEFEPREADRLVEYVAKGGRAIVIVDARKPNGLESWLRAYNVALRREPIVDPRYNVQGRPTWPVAYAMGQQLHPIVEPLRNQAVFVVGATPMELLGLPKPGQRRADPKDAPPNPNVTALPILRTSPRSWAESEPSKAPLELDPKTDIPGPLTVGAAVYQRDPGSREPSPRLVVFSAPLMADNRFVIHPTNMDILVNAVAWLRGRPDLEGIAPKRHEALTLTAGPSLQARLVLIPTTLAFAVILGLGISTYLARRS